MEKRLLENEKEWKALKKGLSEREEDLGFDFHNDEESPKKFPCILFYHYAEDMEFGNVYGIGFCYLDDFQ